jgi:LPXTG-motif cell wall-anchored protein
VYTLSGTTVLFDPESTFSGTVATPVYYAWKDSSNQNASAKITPTIGAFVPPSAVNDAQTTPWDTNQTYSPLANDTASSGATITNSTLKLCALTATAPYSTLNCSATSVTVTGEGVYTLSGTTVLFDPESTFSGTVATPVYYAWKDSSNQNASAKITPTIGAYFTPAADEPVPPSAVDDSQSTPWDTNQTYTPLYNDSASPGATINSATLRLCATSVSAPYTQLNCTVTSVTVPGEGVYTLTGNTVLFDPYPTFSGTVKTPVHYVFLDSTSQLATAKITPTIGDRNGLVALDDEQTTPWDTNQTYFPLTNDSASRGATIVKSTLKLCATSVSAPYTQKNCTATSITVPGEGVYTLSGNTVLFDPEPTFTGTVKTPIQYVYVDSTGSLATAKITPTIGDRVKGQLPQTGSNTMLLFVMMVGLLLAVFVSLHQMRIRD